MTSWSSLELRLTAVARRSDVVFPVAPAVEKAGSLPRLGGPAARRSAWCWTPPRSATRVLDALARDMRDRTRLPGRGRVRRELGALPRPEGDPAGRAHRWQPAPASSPGSDEAVLASWHQLVDLGSLTDGDEYLAGTARPAVVRLAGHGAALSVADGATVVVASDRGRITAAGGRSARCRTVWSGSRPTRPARPSGAASARRSVSYGPAARVGDAAVARVRSSTRGCTVSPDVCWRRIRRWPTSARPVVAGPRQDRLGVRLRAASMTCSASGSNAGWSARMAVRPGPEPGRPVRSAADARRRPEDGMQGGHPTEGRRQGGVLLRSDHVGDLRGDRVVGGPLRPDGEHLRPPDPLQVTDVPVAVLVVLACSSIGHLRHRARWLGLRLDLPTAGWPTLHGPDDLVRGHHGTVHRGGLHDRRHHVDQR